MDEMREQMCRECRKRPVWSKGLCGTCYQRRRRKTRRRKSQFDEAIEKVWDERGGAPPR